MDVLNYFTWNGFDKTGRRYDDGGAGGRSDTFVRLIRIYSPPPPHSTSNDFTVARSHAPLLSGLRRRVYFGFNVDFPTPPTSLNLKSSARLPHCLRIYRYSGWCVYVYCVHTYITYTSPISRWYYVARTTPRGWYSSRLWQYIYIRPSSNLASNRKRFADGSMSRENIIYACTKVYLLIFRLRVKLLFCRPLSLATILSRHFIVFRFFVGKKYKFS